MGSQKTAFYCAAFACLTACCLSPAISRAQDAPAPQAQFLTSCGTCHSAEKGAAPRQGPNLAGVYGRRAGSLPDYHYSDALKAGGWVWDDTTLDPWMENAQAVHPGTIMSYRQRDPAKRALILEYLKTLKAEP
jgi:cytochrome c